ncbi:TolC family protein [Anatilimnocola floriformis]|uniref:TolC family protein n=1 Tax=Anatilimnocola floriformis TaxID=2948575 RepID=UPI0020C2E823|nr:TolC family protein [Anatilimnocola floriformis]
MHFVSFHYKRFSRCRCCAGVLAMLFVALSQSDATAQPLSYRSYHLEQRSTVIRQPADFRSAPLPPSAPPPTVAKPGPDRFTPQRISLDDAIRIALENDRVVRVLAGETAVNSGKTIYDVAIANTVIDQRTARFNPFLTVNNNWDRLELPTAFPDPGDPTNTLIGGFRTDQHRLDVGVSKINPLGGQFDAGVNTVSQRFQPGVFPLNPQNTSSASIAYTQPLLQGFGRPANLAPVVLARIDTERSYFQLKDAVQTQVRSVIEAYWSLIAARIDVWATEQQVAQAKFAHQFAQQRFKVGIRNGSDQAQARTSLANFQANLINARNAVLQREAVLRNLLGLPPWDEVQLTPTTEPASERFEPDWLQIVELAAQQRPDLIELKLILEADEQQLIIANNTARPRLDAVALYRWNGLEGETPAGMRVSSGPGQFTDYTLGVNFSMPLGLRRERSQLRQRELILARDQANLQQGLHAASHELATTLRSLERAYEQYLAYREARAAAAENLKIQEGIFRGEFDATFSYLNVLLAITDWGNAVRNEATALTQYNTLLAELERQTGTILESHGVWFYEERYGSIGPLGRLARPVQYPARNGPLPNAERYPSGERPAEDFFQMTPPVRLPELRREELPPPAPQR